MSPPGGVYALTATVLVLVLVLIVTNAGRGEWDLVAEGVIVATVVVLSLLMLRPPKM